MTIDLDDSLERIWSPLAVVAAGSLFALPAAALIVFGVLALA